MPDNIEQALQEAMRQQTCKIVEEEAEAAAKRVSERVRAMAGQIATKVVSETSFQRRGNELVMTVKIPQ